ncbi:hypothetical protein OROMI_024747 [Orobanche minor]
MNYFAIQQKSFAPAEEMRSSATAACRSVEMKEPLVCPKPRRLGLLHATLNEPTYARPFRWHSSYHQENFDSKAGNELLDFIMSKESRIIVDLATTFEREGISAFRFDFSGNGESEGSFQFANYFGEVEELRSVVEHFVGLNRSTLAVLGHSKGIKINLTLVSLFEGKIPCLKRPFICCSPRASVRHLCQYRATTNVQVQDA